MSQYHLSQPPPPLPPAHLQKFESSFHVSITVRGVSVSYNTVTHSKLARNVALITACHVIFMCVQVSHMACLSWLLPRQAACPQPVACLKTHTEERGLRTIFLLKTSFHSYVY